VSDARKPLVVVGVDGSEHGMVALRRAISEAELRDAELHVVYVSDIAPAILHLADAVTVDTAAVAEAQRKAVWEAVGPTLGTTDHPVTKVNLEGYPADALVDYCEEKQADLLVMGTRGRGRIASTFLGSTSSRALEHAKCDVLVAKPPRP
jgi:nucleotide-binding universal stress UspA family protein